MVGGVDGFNACESGFGAVVGMGGNAAAVFDFDKPAGGEGLADRAAASLGASFLAGGISGAFDSASSREMISLPSASFSGVVPNLATQR